MKICSLWIFLENWWTSVLSNSITTSYICTIISICIIRKAQCNATLHISCSSRYKPNTHRGKDLAAIQYCISHLYSNIRTEKFVTRERERITAPAAIIYPRGVGKAAQGRDQVQYNTQLRTLTSDWLLLLLYCCYYMGRMRFLSFFPRSQLLLLSEFIIYCTNCRARMYMNIHTYYVLYIYVIEARSYNDSIGLRSEYFRVILHIQVLSERENSDTLLFKNINRPSQK